MAEEKKIIIDEDWKAQVQAEKEAAAKMAAGETAGSQTVSAGTETGTEASLAAESDDLAMPPASFELLVTTLATEALVALGQVPHPATGKAQLNRNQAQYLIDTLDVLRQKSKGNLDSNEQQMIDSLLHQLRMAFVALTAQPASSSGGAQAKVER